MLAIKGYFLTEKAIANKSKIAVKPAIARDSIPIIGLSVNLEIKATTILITARPISVFTKFFIATSFSYILIEKILLSNVFVY